MPISSTTSGIKLTINTHDGGWDYPVQYTDGSHGYTTFNDIGQWYNDVTPVPNPAEGYHPSTGSDGHLVVVDTLHRMYYDFWALTVDGNGNPNTHVGQIASGSLDGNGTPGTTATKISGLAGDILPGELDCSTCLNHALNVVVPAALNAPGICGGANSPAKGYDGRTAGGIFCEGAKLRFDPSIDVNSLPASNAAKAVALALQKFGGVITDQTGAYGISFYSALPSQPDTTGMQVIAQHLFIYR